MGFVSCQCTVKYPLCVLKCTLTTPYGFVFLCSSPYLVNQSGLLRIRNERTKPRYVCSRKYDPVECLAEVMQSEIYPRSLRTVSVP